MKYLLYGPNICHSSQSRYEPHRFPEVTVEKIQVTLRSCGAQPEGVCIEMERFGRAHQTDWSPCLNIYIDQGLDKGKGICMRN